MMCENDLLIRLPFPPTSTGATEDESCELESWRPPSVRTILLVEHRDEVSARLATDLAAAGMRTVQAKTTTEGLRRCVREPTALLVVNADQPGESAWLLAAKLHLTHPAARIWVYMHRASTFDVEAANFLTVDELIEYRGDLSRLTGEILARFEPAARSSASTGRSAGRTGPVEAIA
jgi:DNA-binding NtrC family response regulator